MTELTQDLSLAQAHSLINSYAFDLEGSNAEQLLKSWLDIYHASWIRLATVEALYRGRYKSVSIEQILSVWSRLGSPNTHFTYEFERLICHKLPQHLSDLSSVEGDRSSDLPVEGGQPQAPYGRPADLSQAQVSRPPFQGGERLTKTQELTILEYAQKTNSESNLNLEPFQQLKSSSSDNIPMISAWGFPCQTDWSEFAGRHKIIHQFIPLPDVSSFFNKLKTFGEEKLER